MYATIGENWYKLVISGLSELKNLLLHLGALKTYSNQTTTIEKQTLIEVFEQRTPEWTTTDAVAVGVNTVAETDTETVFPEIAAMSVDSKIPILAPPMHMALESLAVVAPSGSALPPVLVPHTALESPATALAPSPPPDALVAPTALESPAAVVVVPSAALVPPTALEPERSTRKRRSKNNPPCRCKKHRRPHSGSYA
eukprot:c18589_g1_i2.p1 GENE.c18589_g1_i2~~c18589_g1_i2.p1  ORF type:complete len:218 (+),score=28.17 c18589_g1_i2:62-655(+)